MTDHERNHGMSSQTKSLVELINDSGRNDATIARRCKIGIGTVQRWRNGAAPRYKFVTNLAKALGVDEQKVHDAVRLANQATQRGRHNAAVRGDAVVVASTDAVQTACLDALVLAHDITQLPKEQRVMLQQFVKSLS
jgi:transcriptional regulator with XRE-family HTH domain